MADLTAINLNGTNYTLASESAGGGLSDIGDNVKQICRPFYIENFGGNAWFGILISVKAGDIVETNKTTMSVLALRNPVQIYDIDPTGDYITYTDIDSHVLYEYSEATANNQYEVPSTYTTAKSMFISVKYGSKTNELVDGKYLNNKHYAAWIVDSAQDGLAPYYLLNQPNGYVLNDDCRSTLFYSLFGAASGLVNANILVLGDSITETVAKDVNDNTTQGNRPYWGKGFITRIVRKYNMTCDIYGESSSRWFPTTGKNSCVDMVKAVCFPEGDAPSADKYNYIIIEYGTNDILFRPNGYGTLADVASDALNCSTVSAIRYCIESLQTTFPFAKILIVMPFIRSSANQTNQAAYIELADQVFDEYGIKRVYPRTQAGITSALMCSDGIHLHVKSDADDPTMLAEGVKRLSECIEGGLLTM